MAMMVNPDDTTGFGIFSENITPNVPASAATWKNMTARGLGGFILAEAKASHALMT